MQHAVAFTADGYTGPFPSPHAVEDIAPDFWGTFPFWEIQVWGSISPEK
jgi:hypothetical protein